MIAEIVILKMQRCALAEFNDPDAASDRRDQAYVRYENGSCILTYLKLEAMPHQRQHDGRRSRREAVVVTGLGTHQKATSISTSNTSPTSSPSAILPH